MAENDDFIKRSFERANELSGDSLSWSHAHSRAWFEHMVEEFWPPKWEDNLEVLIFGDFRPPKSEIHNENLGITLYPEALKKTVIQSALCVLKASISVDERSIASMLNAIKRLNLFLGAMTLSSWGNNQVGWWCHLTHGPAAVDIQTGRSMKYCGPPTGCMNYQRQ